MQQYKKLLLTGLVALSSISIANAVCTPPTTLKCACQHPIINSEGKLACGEDYCAKNGKKCMPDGSCCETEKHCASSEQGLQCCADGQTCDATKGCVDGCEEGQLSCKIGTDAWCCDKGNTCGSSINSCNKCRNVEDISDENECSSCGWVWHFYANPDLDDGPVDIYRCFEGTPQLVEAHYSSSGEQGYTLYEFCPNGSYPFTCSSQEMPTGICRIATGYCK